MDLDDENEPGTLPKPKPAAGKNPLAGDSVPDVEFDLIDEDEVEPDAGERGDPARDDHEHDEIDDDVFARETAIPASPPEQLAAEAMRRDPHSARLARPELPRPPLAPAAPSPPAPPSPASPPPLRSRRDTPATIEPPPSGDLEFDGFDAPIDIFGQPLPGTKRAERAEPQRQHRTYGQSEMPTRPPGPPAPPAPAPAPAPRRTASLDRGRRPAFLAETAKNRPIDPELLARSAARSEPPENSTVPFTGGDRAPDSALDFVDGHDPLPSSVAPMSGLEPPSAPPNQPATVKDLEQCYAVGDYSRALQIAEQLLARSPDDLSARRHAQNCRDILTQMFAARIGPLDQVVSVVVSPQEIQWLSLDHRAGFLLSLVDGQSTVDEILDISGMTRLDALKIIHDLTEQHVVRLG